MFSKKSLVGQFQASERLSSIVNPLLTSSEWQWYDTFAHFLLSPDETASKHHDQEKLLILNVFPILLVLLFNILLDISQ